jgi:hypothetical protein
MKNLRLLIITILLLPSLIGCTASVDKAAVNREEELEKRIEEQEIISIEKSESQVALSSTSTDNPLDLLTKDVENAIAKADAAIPSGTSLEKQTTFFDIMSELEKAEQEIDIYKEYLESQYRQNLLSYEEYLSQKKQLNKLESDLDAAEERLEITFRMDD